MQFNKTKRTLEKVAGILTTVFNALWIIGSIVMIILANQPLYGLTFVWDGHAYMPETTYYANPNATFLTILFIILLIFSIIGLILSILLIKSPLKADGTVKQRNGIRITLLIFSILNALWVTSVLLIIVLCMKDFVDPNNSPVANTISNLKNPKPYAQTTEGKIAEIKHMKELGVIDDATYERAIKKITDDLLKD